MKTRINMKIITIGFNDWKAEQKYKKIQWIYLVARWK